MLAIVMGLETWRVGGGGGPSFFRANVYHWYLYLKALYELSY